MNQLRDSHLAVVRLQLVVTELQQLFTEADAVLQCDGDKMRQK